MLSVGKLSTSPSNSRAACLSSMMSSTESKRLFFESNALSKTLIVRNDWCSLQNGSTLSLNDMFLTHSNVYNNSLCNSTCNNSSRLMVGVDPTTAASKVEDGDGDSLLTFEMKANAHEKQEEVKLKRAASAKAGHVVERSNEYAAGCEATNKPVATRKSKPAPQLTHTLNGKPAGTEPTRRVNSEKPMMRASGTNVCLAYNKRRSVDSMAAVLDCKNLSIWDPPPSRNTNKLVPRGTSTGESHLPPLLGTFISSFEKGIAEAGHYPSSSKKGMHIPIDLANKSANVLEVACKQQPDLTIDRSQTFTTEKQTVSVSPADVVVTDLLPPSKQKFQPSSPDPNLPTADVVSDEMSMNKHRPDMWPAKLSTPSMQHKRSRSSPMDKLLYRPPEMPLLNVDLDIVPVNSSGELSNSERTDAVQDNKLYNFNEHGRWISGILSTEIPNSLRETVDNLTADKVNLTDSGKAEFLATSMDNHASEENLNNSFFFADENTLPGIVNNPRTLTMQHDHITDCEFINIEEYIPLNICTALTLQIEHKSLKQSDHALAVFVEQKVNGSASAVDGRRDLPTLVVDGISSAGSVASSYNSSTDWSNERGRHTLSGGGNFS